MKTFVQGLAWITPLGDGIEEVWQKMVAGETAPVNQLTDPETGAEYIACRVPQDLAKASHPRLRRVSAISRFAAAAGLAALQGTGISRDQLGLVFAISNGGVVYTRRFYSEIARAGAQAASPLLFPETVFNAPASHLAAILGIEGASYTVVGDGAVGIAGLQLANDILHTTALEACLVVGAEELDPLICRAYQSWRLLRRSAGSRRGMMLGEGAGAVLLSKQASDLALAQVDGGTNYFHRSELPAKMQAVGRNLGPAQPVLGSANGTFIDRAEESAFGRKLFSPKAALGDGVGASVLWQLITAAQILRTKTFPGGKFDGESIVAIAAGMNQQLGGFRLVGQSPS